MTGTSCRVLSAAPPRRGICNCVSSASLHFSNQCRELQHVVAGARRQHPIEGSEAGIECRPVGAAVQEMPEEEPGKKIARAIGNAGALWALALDTLVLADEESR